MAVYKRKVREIVLESIFQMDFGNMDSELIQKTIENSIIYKELGEEYIEEALDYIRYIKGNLGQIDEIIQKYSKNWSIDRIGNVERNILRIAIFELMKKPEIPTRVVFDEAVEITKKYSDEEGSKFVNGLLDRIAKEEIKRTDIGEGLENA